jgi:hypothetical protein
MSPKSIKAVDAYGGKNHLYTLLHTHMGIKLYLRTTDLRNVKTNRHAVYTPVGNYMMHILGNGCFHDTPQKCVEWVQSFPGGLLAHMVEFADECFAEPMQWVDIACARVAGKLERARTHNAAITAQREHEYDERERIREKVKREEARAEREKVIRAITDAERAIIASETVTETNVGDKSLTLQLMRKYGIAVPLRTQGWIKKYLVSFECYPKEGKVERTDYKHYGRESTVVSEYLYKLYQAVCAAYAVNA